MQVKKIWTLNAIVYAFILLFVYTALSKWFMYTLYVNDLHRSPQLGPYAGIISIVIPASELLISALLLLGKTKGRKWGLYGAFLLMLMFTAYVAWVLNFTYDRPCTCGGIIRNLSWKNHMLFNIVFTILALIGIYLERRLRNTNTSDQAKFVNA